MQLYDTFLQKLLGEPTAEPKSTPVGRPRGRPPKPVEELVAPPRRIVNGRSQRVGKRYGKNGLVKRNMRGKTGVAGNKHWKRKKYLWKMRSRKARAKSREHDYKYYKTVQYGFYRYRRKIRHRKGIEIPLTLNEYRKIWDEADDVFHDGKLTRPWNVKAKSWLLKDGAYIQRVNDDGPYDYNNMRIFYRGKLVPRKQ